MQCIHMVQIKGSVCSELMALTGDPFLLLQGSWEVASPGAPDKPGRPLLWDHIPVFPDVELSSQGYCVWFLTQPLDTGEDSLGLDCHSPEDSHALVRRGQEKGRRRSWTWWITTVIATVTECNVTMAIIICKKIPKFVGEANPESKL